MPDPMDELENFTSPGLTMDPLPAAEVRRRGTRLRRRNTALAAAGGVLAVAVIATPFAVMADHTGSSEPQPAPSPSASWQQTIPADFPLAEGLPTPVDTTSTYASPVTDVCKGMAWDTAGTTDLRQATYTASEGGSTHTLALYSTERDAERTLLSLQAAAQACAVQTDGQDRTVELLTTGQDGESLTYANHYSDGGDLDAVRFVRAGNAILQATRYSIGVPAQDTADQVVQESATVVDSMCVFSAAGCDAPTNAVDPTPDGSPAVTTVPADFPLLDGLPTTAATKDFGRYGPKPEKGPLGVIGCTNDVSVAPSGTVERLGGGWTDPAEARVRQLMTFSSADEATTYLDMVSNETSCNPQDVGDGVTEIHSGAGSDLGLGDEALIAVTWYRHNGNPAPGFRITELVRVGNAVIVQTRTADGYNDPVTSAYLEQIIGESDQSLAGVVDAMCVFAATGC
ncbi:hypothetical protein ABLE68_02830 [Nocardioides sp. CN2-186]|uniref:hypothetical protein n=1 Tax=Nocardioides tweenelious TaxID=3156607 RepID=UPI0032B4B314